jgi:hypothetical protein
MNFQKLLDLMFLSVNLFWKGLGLVQDLAVVVEVVLVVHLADLVAIVADLVAIVVDLVAIVVDLMTLIIDQGFNDVNPAIDININKNNFIFLDSFLRKNS